MSNLTPGHNQKNKKRRKKIIFWFFISLFLVLSTFTVLLLAQNNEPNSYVKVNEAYYILNEGESTLVTFEASQDLGAFTYTSNDTSVVQFIENRLITVGTGSTTITVSSQSNPSIFQTVSVIVRERVIEPNVPEVPVEPEVPVDPEGPVEPEPELPEEPVNPEPEVPVDPEPEVPVDPDDESVVTPPTIYTITITNETGAVITTLELEEGSFITTSSLELPELFKGFFLEGETCNDDPFDLETPITENLTLIQASFNDQAPCLQLDYIVLSGRPVAGTTLTVDIFPLGANVTISWYTSVNNRTYREIPGESGSTYTVRPEDSGKFIRVYVVSDSNPPVVRYDTIKLDVFGTVSNPGTSDNPPSQQIQAIIDQGFIPISTHQDLRAIGQNVNYTFTAIINDDSLDFFVTNSALLSQKYFLINHLDLSGYTDLTQSFINGTFTGTLDGNGYKISGLSINTSTIIIGLFKGLGGNARIQNLIIEDFNITGGSRVGSLAGIVEYSNLSNVVINNVTVSNSSINGSFDVGGLIGGQYVDTTLTPSITFSGITLENVSVDGSSDRIGGIMGTLLGTGFVAYMEDITFNVNINSAGDEINNHGAGGLIGMLFKSKLTIQSATGTTIITGLRNAGGLVGMVKAGSTLNVESVTSFAGSINGTESLGGIIGRVDSGTINIQLININHSGSISGTGIKLGGIIGVLRGGTTTLSSITYSGDITGDRYVGGLIGRVQTPATQVNIENTTLNAINVTGTNSDDGLIGGLIGEVRDSSVVTLSAIHISGSGVHGTKNVGGILGVIQASSTLTGTGITIVNTQISGNNDKGYIIGRIFSTPIINLSGIDILTPPQSLKLVGAGENSYELNPSGEISTDEKNASIKNNN